MNLRDDQGIILAVKGKKYIRTNEPLSVNIYAPPGTGKTTLCRAILDKLEGRAETVYIINPSLSDVEIIQAILDDLGIDYPEGASKKILLDHLNLFLLEVTTDKPVVIIIDDAQTMTPEGLENLRLLSNLETDKKKLLQLVLIGQQELQELLLEQQQTQKVGLSLLLRNTIKTRACSVRIWDIKTSK